MFLFDGNKWNEIFAKASDEEDKFIEGFREGQRQGILVLLRFIDEPDLIGQLNNLLTHLDERLGRTYCGQKQRKK